MAREYYDQEALDIYLSLISKAEKALSRKEYDLAISLCDKILSYTSNSNDQRTINCKVKCLENLEKFDEAIEYYEKLSSINPSNIYAIVGQGRCFEKQGKYANAIKCYDRAIALESNNNEALEGKVRCRLIELNNQAAQIDLFLQKKEYDKAIEFCNKILAEDKFNEQALRAKLQCLEEQEKFEEAIDCYDKLFADKGDNRVFFNKAKCLEKARKYDAATNVYFYLKAQEDLSRTSILKDIANKADEALKNKEYDKALQFFEREFKEHPSSGILLLKKGFCLQQLGKYNDAILCYSDIRPVSIYYRDSQKNKATCYLALGDLCLEKKDYDTAEGYYSNSMELGSSEAKEKLATCLVKYAASNMQSKDAVYRLKRALQLNPRNKEAFYAQGLINQTEGKYKEAVKFYESVLAIDKDHEDSQINLHLCKWQIEEIESAQLDIYKRGEALQKDGKYEEAITCYTQIVEDSECYKNAQASIALCYRKQADNYVKLKNYSTAEEYYNIAIRIGDVESKKNLESCLLEYAQYFINNKNFDDAKGCYERILKINPKNSTVLYKMGALYESAEKFEEAIEYYKKSAIKNFDFYYRIGICFDKLSQYGEALKYYNEACLIAPDHKDCLKRQEECKKKYVQNLIDEANIYFVEKKYENALQRYQEVTEIEPKRIPEINQKAICLQNLERYNEALLCYEDVLTLSPVNPEAISGKAFCFKMLNKYKEALEYYNILFQYSDNDLDILENKAFCHQKLNQYELALECYDAILKEKPNNEQAILNKALCLWNITGNKKEAINFLQKELDLNKNNQNIKTRLENYLIEYADNCYKNKLYPEASKNYYAVIEIHPTNLHALSQYAQCFIELKQYKNALTLYERILKIHPRHTNSLTNKVLCLHKMADDDFSQGKYSDALKLYNQAIEIDPKNMDILYKYGQCLQKLGQYGDALKVYKRVLTANNKNEDALFSSGLCLKEKGEYREAVEVYERLLKINPQHENALKDKELCLSKIAYECFIQNQYNDAIIEYDRIININPDNITALYNKGLCLQKLNKYKEAVRCYENVLRKDPSHTDAKKNRKNCALEYSNKTIQDANANFEQKLYGKALDYYNEVPDDVLKERDLLDKAYCCEQLEKYDEALGCYKAVLIINPDNHQAKLADKKITLAGLSISKAINGFASDDIIGKELAAILKNGKLNSDKYKQLHKTVEDLIRTEGLYSYVENTRDIKIATFHVARALQTFMVDNPSQENHVSLLLKTSGIFNRNGIKNDTELKSKIKLAIADAKREINPKRYEHGDGKNDLLRRFIENKNNNVRVEGSVVSQASQSALSSNYSAPGQSTLVNNAAAVVSEDLATALRQQHEEQKKHSQHPMAPIETGCGDKANTFAACMNQAMQAMYSNAYDIVRHNSAGGGIASVADYASRFVFSIPGMGLVASSIGFAVIFIRKIDENDKKPIYNAMYRGESTEYTIRITAEKAGKNCANYLDSFSMDEIQFLGQIAAVKLCNSIGHVYDTNDINPEVHSDLYLKAISLDDIDIPMENSMIGKMDIVTTMFSNISRSKEYSPNSSNQSTPASSYRSYIEETALRGNEFSLYD